MSNHEATARAVNDQKCPSLMISRIEAPPRRQRCPADLRAGSIPSRNPSFRALSGRLKLTVRRHRFNEDSLSATHPRKAGGGGLAPI